MSTWADVGKGDRVELGGKTFTVRKLKAKGKRAAVTVDGQGGRFESEVKLKDAVKILPATASSRDAAGWHKPTKAERKAEAKAAEPKSQAQPKAKLSTDSWEARRDKVESKLDRILGAVLVGEATDEDAGYYVPPVDPTTVMAHGLVFHGWQPSDFDNESDVLAHHEQEHRDALIGDAVLKVTHWHTETRPGAKKR